MGKTFQAAQLTHERFLTIDHSCKIFFWYLPNWTSTNLWCVVLYATYSTTHQRSVEVQFGRYQKNILQEWYMVKNLSCVSCAAWNVFPINSLLLALLPYAWQLPDDCLKTAWWLPGDYLMTVWQLPDHCLMTAIRLPYDFLITAWQLLNDCLTTTGKQNVKKIAKKKYIRENKSKQEL